MCGLFLFLFASKNPQVWAERENRISCFTSSARKRRHLPSVHIFAHHENRDCAQTRIRRVVKEA